MTVSRQINKRLANSNSFASAGGKALVSVNAKGLCLSCRYRYRFQQVFNRPTTHEQYGYPKIVHHQRGVRNLRVAVSVQSQKKSLVLAFLVLQRPLFQVPNAITFFGHQEEEEEEEEEEEGVNNKEEANAGTAQCSLFRLISDVLVAVV